MLKKVANVRTRGIKKKLHSRKKMKKDKKKVKWLKKKRNP